MTLSQVIEKRKVVERVDDVRYVDKITVGYTLAQLLRGVDTLETNIGNIKNVMNDGESLIVSGYSINYRGESCDLLSNASIAVDISSKFGKAFGKSALELLKTYIKSSKCEDGLELVAKFRAIQSNKLLIEPIKPGIEVNVAFKGRDVRTRIDTSKWRYNSESKQLECVVITDKIPAASNKRLKILLESYGKEITSVDVEREFSKINRDIISMTKFGLIRPIAIRDDLGILIIDNQYAYFIGDGDDKVSIAGGWSLGKLAGLEKYKKRINRLTFKKLEECVKYLGKHKRYIAPYGLLDCNVINSKDI